MKRKQIKKKAKKTDRKMKRKTRQKYSLVQLQETVGKLRDSILKGTVIAIDPSCISSSSVPGWAVYRKGILESSGTIEGISPYVDLNRRLMYIGRYIRENFEEPDVLVLEKIRVSRN